VVGGRWSVVGGRWSVVGGRRAVVGGRWSEGGGRRAVVGGQNAARALANSGKTSAALTGIAEGNYRGHRHQTSDNEQLFLSMLELFQCWM
jgi:hypothetical protein